MRSRLLLLLLPLFLASACTTLPSPRPPALSVEEAGIVSTADPRASEAGRAILREGGSAVDAALAIMLALTVVEPQSSGIGGGGFLLSHDARTHALRTFDGRETAPSSARSDLFLDAEGKPLPFGQARTGGKSVGIPGNLRLMALAHAKSGHLPWASIFMPAIRLARDGFLVTPRLHDRLESARELLWASDEARSLYFTPDGMVKPVGTRITNAALANLLEAIAKGGADHFYTGAPAERLIATVAGAQSNPAVIRKSDLESYQARERPPICGGYRKFRICGMGPPSSGGLAVLTILKQLERFDLATLGPDNPVSWHLLGESMRLAYADRAKWIGDPDFSPIPIEMLSNESYIRSRSSLISEDRAMSHVGPGTFADAPAFGCGPATEVPGTSHFSVLDRYGNAASMTSTIESGFGSGLMIDGYVLNNELTDFSFLPAPPGRTCPNQVAPGKRPLSSMSPTIVYDDQGKLVAVLGAAGGMTIIAQVAKALVGILDWKLPAAAALALPQIVGSGDRLLVEGGTSLEAMAPALTRLGHKVVVTDFSAQGHSVLKLNGIARLGRDWEGAADPRSEGRALRE